MKTHVCCLAALTLIGCLENPRREPGGDHDSSGPPDVAHDLAGDVFAADATAETGDSARDLGVDTRDVATIDQGDRDARADGDMSAWPRPFVRSVRRFSASFDGIAATEDFGDDVYDQTASVPFVSVSASAVTSQGPALIDVSPTSPTQMTVVRDATEGSVDVEVELVEFGPGATVRSDVFALQAGDAGLTLGVEPYDPAHSFVVFWYRYQGSGSAPPSSFLSGQASTGSTLRFQRPESAGIVVGRYWLVESPWVDVQHISPAGWTDTTLEVGRPIPNLSKALLLSSYEVFGNETPQRLFVDCYLTSGGPTCRRSASNPGIRVELQLITFNGLTAASHHRAALDQESSVSVPVAGSDGYRTAILGNIGAAGVAFVDSTRLEQGLFRLQHTTSGIDVTRSTGGDPAEVDLTVVDWRD